MATVMAKDAHTGSLYPLVRRYVDERAKRGEIGGGTARTLYITLRSFVEFIGDPKPSSINRRHVEKWLERPVTPSTKRAQLSIVRVFCRWLEERKLLPRDPTRGVKGPRQPRRVPRNMQADAVAKVFAACHDSRLKAICSLMVQEGLRCCEVAGLEAQDIDWSERLVLIKTSKGDHERVLPLSDETVEALTTYLNEHPTTTGPLIRSYNDATKGVTAKYLSHVMSQLMRSAGIKLRIYDGISAHALRHTMATDMLRSGAHLRDVQAALGHKDISTAQKYLPWVVGDLRTAMGGRRYRGTAPAASSD